MMGAMNQAKPWLGCALKSKQRTDALITAYSYIKCEALFDVREGNRAGARQNAAACRELIAAFAKRKPFTKVR